jgi:hypothetical protein
VRLGGVDLVAALEHLMNLLREVLSASSTLPPRGRFEEDAAVLLDELALPVRRSISAGCGLHPAILNNGSAGDRHPLVLTTPF